MKKLLLPVLSLAVMLLLSGCLSFGSNDSKTEVQKPTVGQQLMDLKKAKDAGAINEDEFQTQKQKLLAGK